MGEDLVQGFPWGPQGVGEGSASYHCPPATTETGRRIYPPRDNPQVSYYSEVRHDNVPSLLDRGFPSMGLLQFSRLPPVQPRPLSQTRPATSPPAVAAPPA